MAPLYNELTATASGELMTTLPLLEVVEAPDEMKTAPPDAEVAVV